MFLPQSVDHVVDALRFKWCATGGIDGQHNGLGVGGGKGLFQDGHEFFGGGPAIAADFTFDADYANAFLARTEADAQQVGLELQVQTDAEQKQDGHAEALDPKPAPVTAPLLDQVAQQNPGHGGFHRDIGGNPLRDVARFSARLAKEFADCLEHGCFTEQ